MACLFNRYYGRPEFASGVWCGVELDGQEGRNNGSVQGIRYFSCLPGHGIFVQLNRVELEPPGVRGRVRPGSLERKYNGIGGMVPSGYMSRSSSVSALNKVPFSGFGDLSKKYSTPGLYVSPGHDCGKPLVKTSSSTTKKYLGGLQLSSLKKYSSEVSLHLGASTPSSPGRNLPNNQRLRQCLGSCSEPPKENGQMRSYRSVQDLTLQKKTSPGGSSLMTSSQRNSHYDSTSDYRCSSVNSSGSDRTTQSSPNSEDDSLSATLTSKSFNNMRASLSPDVLNLSEQNPDDAFLASPTEVKMSPQVMTRLVPLPKGLATPVSTFLESASKNGPNRGDCLVPSPEHSGGGVAARHRHGQYAATSNTMHPLVNGHTASSTDGSDTATTEGEGTKRTSRRRPPRSRHTTTMTLFVCPNSGQEISLDNGTVSRQKHPALLSTR